MEILDRESQLIAVEKVLEEMQKAEEYVKSWNASWWEQLLDAYCLPLHYEMGEADVRGMERKYKSRYKLANAFYSSKSIGIPLAKETLLGDNTLTGERCKDFEVEFGRIDWYGMNSHKSERHFSFNNNGIIEFSKSTRVAPKITTQHPRRISYNTSFNVLSNDFDVSITLNRLTEDRIEKYKYDYFTLSLKGNVLVEKYNDIEITRDLSTGMRLVRIAKNLSEKVISFDNSDFNMESVNQAEKRILEMVKGIKGELPLSGLVDRIDNCLELIDKKQNIQVGDGANCRVLKLKSSKK